MSSVSRKRMLPIGADDNVLMPAAKKIRSLTASQVLQQLRQMYNSDLLLMELVGLCAYLTVAVDHGYPIGPGAYDHFAVKYPIFKEARKQELAARKLNKNSFMPQGYKCESYHTWFLEKVPTLAVSKVLTPQRVEAIVTENPYTFMLVSAQMQRIMNE
ncbi:hypothetical protein HRR78_008623 [Exophiala dermatitidis]|nr:hypothetical protein HRR75_000318 [Exophiala dermatitidis]KAJ4536184.1 hypothetical protein HRR78_008623 [Exophiala dermatitidis]